MDFLSLKARVRSLLDDIDGSFATDELLVGLANQSYERIYNKMLATNYAFDEQVVELPNVAAGTTNLSAFMTSGEELEFLFQPMKFEWKQAGTDVTNYRWADKVDTVQDQGPTNSIAQWAWRAGQIYFSNPSAAMDIRITGKFLLPKLTEDDSRITAARNIGHVIAFDTAGLFGIARGNAQWEKSYQALADDSLDDIMQAMVRADQKQVRRVGRVTRRPNRRSLSAPFN